MASDEARWHALAPASALVNLLPDMGRSLRQMWPLFALVLLGRGGNAGVEILYVMAFFILAGARTLAEVFTLRYRVLEGRLEVQRGVLARQHRVLEVDRIQNVEILANPIHRFAGLVELRIELAGGGNDAEVRLSALERDEAERVRAAIRARPTSAASGTPSEELLRNGPLEVMAYGATRVGLLSVLLIAAAIGEWGPLVAPGVIRPIGQGGGLVQAFAILLVAYSGAWVLSVGDALLRHGALKASRVEGTDGVVRLRVERGVLTRRGVEIALRRVQVVGVQDTPLLRALGHVSVRVRTAASVLPGSETGAEAYLPMVPDDALAALLRRVLPSLDADPLAAVGHGLRPAAPRAILRCVLRGALSGLAHALAFAWLVHSPWGLLAGAFGPFRGWLDGRALAWSVTPTHVVVRRGWWTREAWAVPRARLQSVHLVQGPLQRMNHLAGVHLWVAGAGIVLPDLDEAQAQAVYASLLTPVEGPETTTPPGEGGADGADAG